MRLLKDKEKKKKKPSITKLKKILWELVRQEVFRKYGDTCYTCGATNLVGSNRQAGHFITKSTCSMEMAYDISNIRPQCFSCNIWKSGNWVAFEAHLRRDGIDVEELKLRNEQTKNLKYGIAWLEQQIAFYKNNTNEGR